MVEGILRAVEQYQLYQVALQSPITGQQAAELGLPANARMGIPLDSLDKGGLDSNRLSI